jgi:hypothetical protein
MRSRSAAVRTRPEPGPNDGFFPEVPSVPVRPPTVEVRPDSPDAFNQPGRPGLTAGFDRIVDKLFELDAEREYAELEKTFTLGMRASQAEYGHIANALDLAEDCAHRAMKLYANAKVSHAAFEMDAKAILGALRKEIVEKLETHKLAEFTKLKETLGSKAPTGKQITESDIESYMASSHPDEWRGIEIRRAKSEAMVKVMERFADLWKQRSRDLQVLGSGAQRNH